VLRGRQEMLGRLRVVANAQVATRLHPDVVGQARMEPGDGLISLSACAPSTRSVSLMYGADELP